MGTWNVENATAARTSTWSLCMLEPPKECRQIFKKSLYILSLWAWLKSYELDWFFIQLIIFLGYRLKMQKTLEQVCVKKLEKGTALFNINFQSNKEAIKVRKSPFHNYSSRFFMLAHHLLTLFFFRLTSKYVIYVSLFIVIFRFSVFLFFMNIYL